MVSWTNLHKKSNKCLALKDLWTLQWKVSVQPLCFLILQKLLSLILKRLSIIFVKRNNQQVDHMKKEKKKKIFYKN